MKKVIFAIVLFVATSTVAFSQNTKTKPVADAAKSATAVKPDAAKSETAKPDKAISKPVPPDLMMDFIKYNALNQAIADIKQRDGITALEAELQKQGQDLLALAAKDGFHFDPTTQSFVENPPAVAADAPAKPDKK